MAGMTGREDVLDYFTVHEYGKTTPHKLYLFGGWRFPAVSYRTLITDLTKQGYAVVLFIPKKKLIAIGTPYAEIVKAGRLAAEEVDHRVEIDKMIGVKRFAAFGISFGTAFALEVTKRVPEINRLVLLAPFGDFARHVDLWPMHRYFGKVLASQPTSRMESGRVLNKVGPAQNIELMRGKRVLVGYSRDDRIIHSEVTEEMIRLLNRSGVDTEIAIVRGGHLRGIIIHLLRKPYAKFLALSDKKVKAGV